MKRRPPLTADFVRSILDYDPDTGVLRWRARADMPKKWNSRYAGTVAGSMVKGYVQVQISNPEPINYYAHHLAWVHHHGEWPTDQIDHRRNDRSNNRINNLRKADNSENGCNKVMQRNNKSGFVGVHFDRQRGKWRAKINKDGRVRFDQFFDTAAAANAARVLALPGIHGAFARIS